MKLFLFFFIPITLHCQFFDTLSITKKINFVNYLNQNNQKHDALYLLNYFNSLNTIDTLKLKEVKLLLELNQEKKADTLLKNCSTLFPDTSNLNCNFILLQNHVNLLLGNYNLIKKPTNITKLTHYEVWRIQQLCSAILLNNLTEFETIYSSGSCTDPNLSIIEYSIYLQNLELQKRRNKSRFLAGILSAIIPGTGKIYAGKPHEALTTFIPVAFNFAQAGEGYYYKKLQSPHLYVFGSIGSVFYMSNIYGSARAAKRKNLEFKLRIKNKIKFEITKLIKYY